MEKLLFVDKNPYGILIDTYKYCQYLQKKYDITYVCIDYGYPKIESDVIKVKYVPYTKYRIIRGVLFSLMSLYYVLSFNGFIFVSYYPGCDILKRVAFWKKIHVDIRTLSVSPNIKEREKWDCELNKSISCFDSVSVITEGVRNKLAFSDNQRVFIVPLGADVISSSSKDFAKLNLLYIGTLNNRRIKDTVVGFHNYLIKHPNANAHYTIIGDGEELSCIREYVEKFRLESYVELKGRLPYNELKPYFDTCNIGVSYIPITDYYQCQPPTKTFEYIMSGLFCLATSTSENCKIINKTNGCLHGDSADSFYDALEYTSSIMSSLNSELIRNSLKGYTWEEIVNTNLMPVLMQNIS